MTYYKATRMDGTDFYTGKIDYTRVPLPQMSGQGEFPGAGWLHLATTPTECVGASWPCRLFEIEPDNYAQVYQDKSHPHKIGTTKAFVTREIESWKFFGPQGKEVVALVERAKKLSAEDCKKLDSALDSAWASAWDSARTSAWDSARDSAWASAWTSAWDSASASARTSAWDSAWTSALASAGLVSRDLIGKGKFTQEQYDILTIPWRTAIGPIHPDDAPLGRTSEITQKIETLKKELSELEQLLKEAK